MALSRLTLLLMHLAAAHAQQHSDFNGVWRLHEVVPRYTLTTAEFAIGAERIGTLSRMPARFKADWDGVALVLDWAVAWRWANRASTIAGPSVSLAESFHDDSTDSFGTRVRPHSVSFDRTPTDTAKLFDSPEQNSGDHFINVQVLKDLPSSALTPLMGNFRKALGVDCQYCHNQTACDSEGKPTKKTARGMISMTRDLNRREFQGRSATCHRGKPVPLPE
jgi:hypothetical protein